MGYLRFSVISIISRTGLQLAAVLLVLLLFSCPGLPVRELDVSAGRAEQLDLIENHFGVSAKMPAQILLPRDAASAFNAAQAGFDPQDSTEILQKAFDSGAQTVLIPRMSTPWITRPLFITKPLTLIIEEGAVIQAKRGEFMGRNDVLLSILECSGVRIYGYGAFLRMHKTDYQNPPYEKAEWRSIIQIRGSADILVAGLRIESSGGDGIYLGRGKNRITNKDIILRDLIIFEHLRQGISVITAENLLVEKCVIRGTRGTAPEAGIDFEPNREDESIINCNVKNCIIAGNSGAGIQGYFVNMGSTSLPISIIIENCDIYDQLVALFFVGFQNGAHGTLRIIDSDVRGLSLIPDIPELTLSYR